MNMKTHACNRREFLNGATVMAGAIGWMGGAAPLAQGATAQTRPISDAALKKAIARVCQLALNLPRIDTHSHFGLDVGNGVTALPAHGPVSDLAQHRNVAEGIRGLYGVDVGPLYRADGPPQAQTRARALRAAGVRKAIENALDTENIATQLAFCGAEPKWATLQKEMAPRVRLLAYIDDLITGSHNTFCPDRPWGTFDYYGLLSAQIHPLDTFDDLLRGIDARIDSWRSHGVVGMKTSIAYTIGLEVTDPTLDEARAAFARKRSMTRSDATTVMHAAFRHAVLACLRNKLPLVVHTGFQIWGKADLRQSNPMLLHNIISDPRYKDLHFVLLHGGNPYVGETTYLAYAFSNVTIDFTWISWMSRSRFRQALREWLEVVPHDRICWGSDSSTPETIVGNGRNTRAEIAGVLAEMLGERMIDERGAQDFLEACYQTTPARVFGLSAPG